MNSKVQLLCLCLLLCLSSLAQVRYGKIVYERKTNLYKKYKDQDVKQWLEKEDKSKTDVFELYFNDTVSVFLPQESDLKERLWWATSKNQVYQNFSQQKRITVKSFWGEEVVVQDSLCKRQWKITDSKRTINGYSCRKAIWLRKDSVRIYAWYCDEILPNIGPENFVGLPGAILGLATEDGSIVYFAKSVERIEPPVNKLLWPKIRKTVRSEDLQIRLQKDFGKYPWGKLMIKDAFDW